MGNNHSKKHSRNSGYLDTFSSYHFETKEEFDEKEHSVHAIFREVFKSNFSPPIKDILLDPKSRVLDVGCGSGFWLMEMAADFPKTRFVGVDVAPIFPKSTFPNNIKFFQLDLLKGLPFDDNTFDFIHIQALSYEFTESQWESFVYNELARLLKPGGWLEVCDHEMNTTNCGPLLGKLSKAIHNNLISNNINPDIIQRHYSLIKSNPSFSSSTIRHEKKSLPLSYCGTNNDKLVEFGAQFIKGSCKYIYLGPIGQSMKIKRENIESNLDMIEREFKIYQTHLYLHRFYVQKLSS